MSDTKPTQTINLTNRRPVTIITADWPIIAEVNLDTSTENVTETFAIRVRASKHTTKVLVYARYKKIPSSGPDINLVQGDVYDHTENQVLIIHEVVTELEDFMHKYGLYYTPWQMLARQCIADLPPEAI